MSIISTITKRYKINRIIQGNWDILMNKLIIDKVISSSYEIENFKVEDYGFSLIINIPIGQSLKEFRKLIPLINATYGLDSIAYYTSNKKNIKLCCFSYDLNISNENLIFFKWEQIFENSKFRNNEGETFKLFDKKEILHPLTNKVIGYDCKIDIPSGLSYDLLESNLNMLNSNFSVCILKFNSYDDINAKILFDKLSDDETFVPYNVKPYEFLIGLTNYFKPIILNFKTHPNLLIGGTINSGKTMAMFIGLLNLIIHYSSSQVNFYLSMLSSKQDLYVFRNTSHCKCYANTLESVLEMLIDLDKMMEDRNLLFKEYNDKNNACIFNIYDYIDKTRNELPILYLCIDEIAAYAISNPNIKQKSKEDLLKEKCNSLLWKIAREGRSVGIYCVFCTQRGGITCLSGDIKGMLVNQICFYFPNPTSAFTILGDEKLSNLATKIQINREFIGILDDIYIGKTFNLKNEEIENILKNN